jgi:hypothetical protein
MQRSALPAALLFAATFAPAQQISREWHGFVEVPDDAPLRLALHIENPHTANVDSADEGVTALPVDSIEAAGGKLKFEIKSIAGVYEGAIDPDGSRITGTWRQDGGAWPLIWEKGPDPANITEPISRSEAMQEGQNCARWFFAGRLTELWRKLSPVVQQSQGSEAHLKEFRDETIRLLGSETQIVSESVEPAGVLQVYRRIAMFQKAGGRVEVKFAFNPRGIVAAFSIGPVAASTSR